MLELHPGGFFSRTIRVTLNGHDIATIKDRAMSEGSRIFIEGVEYNLSRTGLIAGDYLLETRGQVIARGQKPSFASRRMIAEFGGQRYDLVPKSAFSSTYRVEQFGEQVGSIGPRPLWNSYPAHLPADMPTVYKVFMIALVTLMWTRSDG